MRLDLRPRTAIALFVVVLVVASTGSIVAAEFASNDQPQAETADTVVLEDGSELWPYTSRGVSFEQRTLSINLVVYGDADVTEQLLREAAVGDWEELADEQQDIAPAEEFDVGSNETTVAWGTADGSIRYTYVESADGQGLWLAESYQLSDGDYLGSRHHIRAYNDPFGNDWTAIQAHLEHWDWFHLRHTVHSIEESQLYVEEEFVDRWYVETLQRERFGNDRSSDADGWVTVVQLRDVIAASIGLLLLSTTGFDRRPERVLEWRHDDSLQAAARGFSVVLGLVGLFAAVRFGAIGVERLLPGLNPKLIVAAFYPLLVAGMPIVAYLLSRQLRSVHAFTASALGFSVATLFDYTYLGVLALPLDTFVHRVALAIAIGFIAAGASQTAREPGVELGHVRTGVILWIVAVAVPLLQFL